MLQIIASVCARAEELNSLLQYYHMLSILFCILLIRFGHIKKTWRVNEKRSRCLLYARNALCNYMWVNTKNLNKLLCQITHKLIFIYFVSLTIFLLCVAVIALRTLYFECIAYIIVLRDENNVNSLKFVNIAPNRSAF